MAKLRQGVQGLKTELPLTRAILFGSWTKGRATAHSDIDVLIVYSGEHRKDALALARAHLRVRGLEAHIYTEAEAAPVSDTLQRMTYDGISLLEE